MTFSEIDRLDTLKREYEDVLVDGPYVIVKQNNLFGCLDYNISKDKESKGFIIPIEYQSVKWIQGKFFIIQKDDYYSVVMVNSQKDLIVYRGIVRKEHIDVLKLYNNDEMDRSVFYNGYDVASISPVRLHPCQIPTSILLIEYANGKTYQLNTKTGKRIKGYDSIEATTGFYETTIGGLHGAISQGGEEVLPCKYKAVEFYGSGHFVGK